MGDDLLEAIAGELEVIASWHTGPKLQRVAALAEKVRAASGGQQVTAADITAPSTATTARPQYTEAELAELARLEAEGDKTPAG